MHFGHILSILFSYSQLSWQKFRTHKHCHWQFNKNRSWYMLCFPTIGDITQYFFQSPWLAKTRTGISSETSLTS